MAEVTHIQTVGTLYLGGQQHGFAPGSVVPVPADHAADLIGAAHAQTPLDAAPIPAVAPVPDHVLGAGEAAPAE